MVRLRPKTRRRARTTRTRPCSSATSAWKWLETRPNRKICPVCKAGISKEKVIPLYGRGNTDQKDPREKVIPPRPRGQRPEPDNTGGGNNLFNFGGGGNNGFQMSFGIGAFPFGFFATNMNLGNGGNGGAIPRAGNNQ